MLLQHPMPNLQISELVLTRTLAAVDDSLAVTKNKDRDVVVAAAADDDDDGGDDNDDDESVSSMSENDDGGSAAKRGGIVTALGLWPRSSCRPT